MKRKRYFWSADTLIIFLALACVALCVALAIVRPGLLPYIGGGLVVLLAIALVSLQQVRKALRTLLSGGTPQQQAENNGLASMMVPVAALRGGEVLWYNDAFINTFSSGQDIGFVPFQKLIPQLELGPECYEQGQDLHWNNLRFTVYASPSAADGDLQMLFFIEDTALKTQAEEYLASRPSVIYFVIDTYDEILKEMKESSRAMIIANIDRALEHFISRTSGFLRRVSSSRFMAVVEERHVQDMIATRFDILDEVRKFDEESMSVTLSIGVGRFGLTFKECEDRAIQALDMALGRGGDQAAVYGPNGFEFYGGVARSVEKRTKVKSRIVATAIKDLVRHSEKVLIMGHSNADMDALGAAVGMLRFCRICQTPASIVLNRNRNLVPLLLEELLRAGYGGSIISPEEAETMADENTLLIVVDTHMKHLLESETVYNQCTQVVVVDHHRKMVGHIDNAVVFYHEPYASSASELVSELLQQLEATKENRLTPLEAEALLAGIMLDTRTYSLHTGVRTFEASAYLRRMGAQTDAVKRLFATSMQDYLCRSKLVAQAQIAGGCAVSVSDEIPAECEVVAPQAANDLLTIEGVQASFVAVIRDGTARFSARSMGKVNVQVIMEKLGGGGHLTMAGAQLPGSDVASARQRITQAISEYMAERANGDAAAAN